MLEDLNGSRRPFGLKLYVREVLGIPAVDFQFKPWADDYVAKLRCCVDLWLATGRRKNGTEIPADRGPVDEINEIVERVVEASKVLPTANGRQYSMVLRTLRHAPRRHWQSDAVQSVPQSSLRRSDYPNDTEYLRALYKERVEGRSRTVAEPAPIIEAEDPISVIAAERVFVEMLLSDWSHKIGKCVDPRCGIYFRLGKWNHRYKRGTRCAGCRKDHEKKDKNRRTTTNRSKARELLWDFVAKRFRRQILGHPSSFDDALKSEIVASLNSYIAGDPKLKGIYQKGITSKWLARADNVSNIASRAADKRSKKASRV
jgi:hypothetical protein